jgi:hypothetical protein
VGYDASCTLRIDGAAHKGTAWLEHKDLVFRGPSRLVIPLANISQATADGSVLRVKFSGRVAELEIGDAAATKWAKRITNPPSRLDKLGVKPGMRVAVMGLKDAAFEAELASRDARVVRGAGGKLARVDLLFYRASHREALEQLATLRDRLEPDGALWVVRPKGRPEITESETMAAGKRAGLVDVKVVSFSDTDTAEKFVIPVARRGRPAAAPPRGSTRRTSARRK